jgi:hypothetical protein
MGWLSSTDLTLDAYRIAIAPPSFAIQLNLNDFISKKSRALLLLEMGRSLAPRSLRDIVLPAC